MSAQILDLDDSAIYMAVHTAFRKAIDTDASCIIYNIMSILQDRDRVEIIEKIEAILPKQMQDTETENLRIGKLIRAAFRSAMESIRGFNDADDKKVQEKWRKRYDKLNESYKAHLTNLKVALKMDDDKQWRGFPHFLYYDKSLDKANAHHA